MNSSVCSRSSHTLLSDHRSHLTKFTLNMPVCIAGPHSALLATVNVYTYSIRDGDIYELTEDNIMNSFKFRFEKNTQDTISAAARKRGMPGARPIHH